MGDENFGKVTLHRVFSTEQRDSAHMRNDLEALEKRLQKGAASDIEEVEDDRRIRVLLVHHFWEHTQRRHGNVRRIGVERRNFECVVFWNKIFFVNFFFWKIEIVTTDTFVRSGHRRNVSDDGMVSIEKNNSQCVV